MGDDRNIERDRPAPNDQKSRLRQSERRKGKPKAGPDKGCAGVAKAEQDYECELVSRRQKARNGEGGDQAVGG